MSEQRCVVRAVSWRDFLPWLIIFRTFRLSLSFPLLTMATLGAVLTPIGWRVSERLFSPAAEINSPLSQETEQSGALNQAVAANRRLPSEQPVDPAADLPQLAAQPDTFFQSSRYYGLVYPQLTAPFKALFRQDLTLSQLAYYLFGGLWMLFVWSFFGSAIARTAAVQLGREERCGLGEALQHSRRKFGSYFAAPLYPLLAVALLLSPVALLGFFFLGDSTVVVAAILWIFALIAGFLSVLLLVGLFFGWPLIWGAVATESSDAFDALSRSYAYTYQRPLHYLFYVVVAGILGVCCWVVVGLFTQAVIDITYWAASWGANIGVLSGENAQRMQEVQGMQPGDQATGSLWFGLQMLTFWEHLLWTLAAGFRYSFFWCAATAIYLLLRRDVDQTEFDEVYVDEADHQISLPPLKTDQHGVAGAPDDSGDPPPGEADTPGDGALPEEKDHPDGE